MLQIWSSPIVSWEKETCLHVGHKSKEGEGHPEKLQKMVAQESLWRDCWWDVGKQKVATAVIGDPFLQRVLSQKLCYSLWIIQGFASFVVIRGWEYHVEEKQRGLKLGDAALAL